MLSIYWHPVELGLLSFFGAIFVGWANPRLASKTQSLCWLEKGGYFFVVFQPRVASLAIGCILELASLICVLFTAFLS
jgi:hypothetical protein